MCLYLGAPPLLCLLAATSAFAQAAATSTGSQLILLDNEAVAFQSLAIAADGALSGEGVPDALSLDDLRRIEVAAAADPAAEKPNAIVDLVGGGRVLAKGVMIADDKCRIAWSHGEPLEVPIDVVRAIRLEPAREDADFDKALAAPDANNDRLFLKVEENKLDSVVGLVDSLSDAGISFEIGGQAREIQRERLYGIVVAQPAAQDAAPRCLVTLKDGSTLGGSSLALADAQATLAMDAGGQAVFPWSAVSRVAIRSSRVAFLSDLKPLAEEQQAIVTLPRPWQRDKSVSGGPLVLGTRAFDKGIGVHARSSLTFAADASYDVFAATIGIDAATAGKGDCVFRVLADGQPLLERRMRGTDPPHEIEVPIAGREQVTLLVEPGAGLDLADHANWCDARFIKSAQ